MANILEMNIQALLLCYNLKFRTMMIFFFWLTLNKNIFEFNNSTKNFFN